LQHDVNRSPRNHEPPQTDGVPLGTAAAKLSGCKSQQITAAVLAVATAFGAKAMTQQLKGQVVLSAILEGVDTTGTVATFSDADASDVAANFTVTVNWGDGTTEVGTVTGQNGSFAVAVL
jgi:hypothetical protein